MKYTKTVTIQTEQQFDSLHIGQWFKLGYSGAIGQYLGKTRTGADAVRYGKFGKQNAKRNKLMRQWAKSNGAK